MTVQDNLELGAATRRDWAGIRADLDDVYAMFPKLAATKKRRAGSLSGGEQQMVAIARALMARPRCLLMDEPSAGLAPAIVGDMVDTILALNKRGLTILLVEQNIGVAAAVAEHAYILQGGEITFSGPPRAWSTIPTCYGPISVVSVLPRACGDNVNTRPLRGAISTVRSPSLIEVVLGQPPQASERRSLIFSA